MKIKWFGHSCFKIETSRNILMDPYDESVSYILDPTDIHIITESHQHHDHCAHERIKGQPIIVKTSGIHPFEAITITGHDSWHDKQKGADRGENIIFQIQSEGITLTHLGDLGHILDSETIEKLSDTDILMIPVGGTYTINATEAIQVIKLIAPKIVVPMHYKTQWCDYPIDPLSKFTDIFDWPIKETQTLELDNEKLKQLQKTCIIFSPYTNTISNTQHQKTH